MSAGQPVHLSGDGLIGRRHGVRPPVADAGRARYGSCGAAGFPVAINGGRASAVQAEGFFDREAG
ncbi:hypothetical protein [Rhizohabitans arisaemae]|uniref:hypothetical protein n=1 Tax=Rhizohabitans arisaemae TaxID=2720610 RepID=UPI0024B1CEE5|nr:hypothetical protein [Rhizohabitans arisaemae]